MRVVCVDCPRHRSGVGTLAGRRDGRVCRQNPFTIAQLAAALADAGHDIVSAEPLPAVTSEEPAQAGFSQVPLLSPRHLGDVCIARKRRRSGNGPTQSLTCSRRMRPRGLPNFAIVKLDGDVEEACRLSHCAQIDCA